MDLRDELDIELVAITSRETVEFVSQVEIEPGKKAEVEKTEKND